jgi:hypothetical protein
MRPRTVIALSLLLVLALPARKRWAPDTAEPGPAETIATFTTEPRVGHPCVSYVPDPAAVGGGVKNQDAPEGRRPFSISPSANAALWPTISTRCTATCTAPIPGRSGARGTTGTRWCDSRSS